MYIWNIKALKKSLKEKPISEKESLKYLIVYIFIFSVFVADPPIYENLWQVVSYIVWGLGGVIGALYLYTKNNGKNGKHFLQRYFSIGWVINVRLTVLIYLPVIIIEYLIKSVIFGDLAEFYTWHTIILGLGFYIFLYWRIGYHISEVAENYSKELNH
ncbi:MAG: hypothetical protein GY839_02980 [candidate division Zixibacteria bacterium]|nr:hypothetical protein [candidate division Zixibacteria bacterium]